jgi:uncharacterized glyoxalase superfamily protein PhnB
MSLHELLFFVCVRDAQRAIDFYARTFGATEKYRLVEPSGRIGHAELDFGGTTLVLSEEFPECGVASPRAGEPATYTLHLHVDDADALIRAAVADGAKLLSEPQDQFYGERSGAVLDPFGVRWNIGHSIETVSPEEMQRRYTRLFEGA